MIVCDKVHFCQTGFTPLSRIISLFLPVCANQEPVPSCQKKHTRNTCTHLILRGSRYLLSADSLTSTMYVCVCNQSNASASVHQACLPPSPPLSPRPATGQSYPSNWHHTGSSGAVASAWGNVFTLTSPGRGQCKPTVLLVMLFSQAKVSWEERCSL